MKFKAITNPSARSIRLFIDDDEIAYHDYDELGWTGMKAIEDLFNQFADKLGIAIEQEEDFSYED